jgi:NitT/TauT family transport system substrate-binding protein
MIARALTLIASTAIVFAGANTDLPAQDKIKVVYSSADATNFVWYAAQDAGFYKKHGLEVELIFVPSSTTAVSSMIAGDIQIGNNSGGTVASAVVSGANLVLTGCYINTLPYELVVTNRLSPPMNCAARASA